MITQTEWRIKMKPDICKDMDCSKCAWQDRSDCPMEADTPIWLNILQGVGFLLILVCGVILLGSK